MKTVEQQMHKIFINFYWRNPFIAQAQLPRIRSPQAVTTMSFHHKKRPCKHWRNFTSINKPDKFTPNEKSSEVAVINIEKFIRKSFSWYDNRTTFPLLKSQSRSEWGSSTERWYWLTHILPYITPPGRRLTGNSTQDLTSERDGRKFQTNWLH